MTVMINKFLKNRSGATAVEYALIVALLAAVIVTAVTTLGGGIQTAFSSISDTLENPSAALN